MPGSLPPDALLSALINLARSLPTSTLMDVADRLEVVPRDSRDTALATIIASVPVDASRAVVRRLFDTWSRERPALSPQVISWSLRSAAAMDGWHRAAQ